MNDSDDILRQHLETAEFECRWCWGIDRERVKGEELAWTKLPDASLIYLSCPKCGGSWSEYFTGFDGEYLRDRIRRLHPEMEEENVQQRFEESVDRLFPQHPDGPPKLYRALLVPKD